MAKTAYTVVRNTRLHRDLLQKIAEQARRSGRTVPKEMVCMLERAVATAAEEYELNPLTEVYLLGHDPTVQAASAQIKLYLRPETDAAVLALGLALGVRPAEARVSLLLDALGL